MIMIILGYFLIGILGGGLSGLLGIGGGVFVVPALAYIYKVQNMPSDIIMHLAAGTSLAVMIITTATSLISHLRYRVEFWPIYRRLMLSVIIGTIIGALLAHSLKSHTLSILFGIFIFLVALKMLFQKQTNPARKLPGNIGMSSVGFVIGAKSGLLGVGGGLLSIPFLTYCNVPLRNAVVVSIAIGMTVAVVGAISFILTGLHAAELPQWSLGYVYLPACLPVICGSIVAAPLGAKLSHALPVKILQNVFAIFLLLMGVHMLFNG